MLEAHPEFEFDLVGWKLLFDQTANLVISNNCELVEN